MNLLGFLFNAVGKASTPVSLGFFFFQETVIFGLSPSQILGILQDIELCLVLFTAFVLH